MSEKISEEQDESLGGSQSTETVEDASQNGNESIPEMESPQDPLAQCAEELAAEKDQRLRFAAEFANYRRRMENQRTDWTLRAQAGVLRTLLPILDDLERSLTVAEEAKSEDIAFQSLQSGVRLVRENFVSELEKLGLKRIQTVGTVFDEHLHEAVGQAPAPQGEEDGHILYESQAGYCLRELVLRHAKVIVGIAPASTIPAEADVQ